MKKIECIIRSEKLEELKKSLRDAGVPGLTISDVRGFGAETTRPDNYLVLPKTKIEIYCTDAQTEDLISTIETTCRGSDIGSGKIAVIPLSDVIRIRTGQTGDEAIV